MSVTRTNEVRMLDDIGKAGFTFDSVEDMKQSTAVVVGQKVRTLGYYAPGDGGGNDYEIVAAGAGTDDGGSFIDLAGSGTQARGLFDSIVNVKQFGAVGDGVSDDTSRINAVFADVSGKDIYFPKGVFAVGELNTIQGASEFSITGSGVHTTKVVKTKDDGLTGRFDMLSFFECSDFLYGNFSIDANYSSGNTDGWPLTVRNSKNSIGHDVQITNFKTLGAIILVNSSDEPDKKNYPNNIFIRLTLDGGGVASNGLSIGSSYDCHAIDCHVWNITEPGPGYGLQLKNSSEKCTIRGGSAINCFSGLTFGYDGDTVRGVRNCSVSDVFIDGCANSIVLGQGYNNDIDNVTIDSTDAAMNFPLSVVTHANFGAGGDSNRVRITRILSPSDSKIAEFRGGQSNNLLNVGLIITDMDVTPINFIGNDTLNNIVNIEKITNDANPNPSKYYDNTDSPDNNSNIVITAGSHTNTPNGLVGTMGGSSLSFTKELSSTININSATSFAGIWLNPNNSNFHSRIRADETGMIFRTLSKELLTLDLNSFRPLSEANNLTLGSSTRRWDVVYAKTGTIDTSDAREKQQVRSLSDAEKACAIQLKSSIRAFKWNDAVEEKGDGARWHFGVIAQTVRDVFAEHGLDAHEYGLFCYDEWEDELDEEGDVAIAAGNRYGVRYDQLLAFIISAM